MVIAFLRKLLVNTFYGKILKTDANDKCKVVVAIQISNKGRRIYTVLRLRNESVMNTTAQKNGRNVFKRRYAVTEEHFI